MVTGNLWSLINPMKNGNFISLLLYGFVMMYVIFFVLRDFSSKKLVHSFILIAQACITFGLFPSSHSDPLRLQTLQALSLCLMSVCHPDFISIVPIVQLNHTPRSAIVAISQYLQMNFYQSLEAIGRYRPQKEADDEETKEKKKNAGIINQYFRV